MHAPELKLLSPSQLPRVSPEQVLREVKLILEEDMLICYTSTCSVKTVYGISMLHSAVL